MMMMMMKVTKTFQVLKKKVATLCITLYLDIK